MDKLLEQLLNDDKGKGAVDEFTYSYIETALWSSTDDDEEPMDAGYSMTDIDNDTFIQMVMDCKKFQKDNFEAIRRYPVQGQHNAFVMAGHNFWLTRNHHGAGYWEEDDPASDQLDKASKEFGEFYLYIGDDNKIHGSPLRKISVV